MGVGVTKRRVDAGEICQREMWPGWELMEKKKKLRQNVDHDTSYCNKLKPTTTVACTRSAVSPKCTRLYAERNSEFAVGAKSDLLVKKKRNGMLLDPNFCQLINSAWYDYDDVVPNKFNE